MDEIRVTGVVGEHEVGPYKVPSDTQVEIGRAVAGGLWFEDDWAPRRLARLVPVSAADTTLFDPHDEWWLLINGESGSMRVTNAWFSIGAADRRAVGGAALRFGGPDDGVELPPGATVALPPGLTVVRWPVFEHLLEFRLDVGGETGDCIAVLRAEDEPVDVDSHARTVFPAGDDSNLLSPRQRRIAAVVFRHLLEGGPRPRNLAHGAAKELGCNAAMVRQDLFRIRMAVNCKRSDRAELNNADELGEYLVLRARIITSDDLPR